MRKEAARWLLRSQGSGSSEFDRVEFKDWLSADPAHRQAYEETKTAWAAVGSHATEPEVVKARTTALENFRNRARARWSDEIQGRTGLTGLQLKVAAMLLIVVAPLVVFMTNFATDDSVVHSTAIGETSVLTLDDGTRLSLDANSSVTVLITDNVRVMKLNNGRVHFDVGHDPRRPFQVHANANTVVAVGTEFSVERLASSTIVTLLEGKVDVFSAPADRNENRLIAFEPDESMRLAPGQMLSIDERLDQGTITTVDTQKAVAWRQGQLVFEAEPLHHAIERVNRYSREQIVTNAADFSDIAIDGVFNSGDTTAFVEALEAYFSIRSRRVDNETILLYRSN